MGMTARYALPLPHTDCHADCVAVVASDRLASLFCCPMVVMARSALLSLHADCFVVAASARLAWSLCCLMVMMVGYNLLSSYATC